MKLTVAITLGVAATVTCGIVFWFLKQEYRPARVIRQADQFITFLQNENVNSAYELTLKTPAVGSTLAAFSQRAPVQFHMKQDQIDLWKISYFQSHAG